MKLKLEAFLPAEGIGIIRSGRVLRLVCPPYGLQDAPVLSMESLEDALLRHGFSEAGEEFKNWEEAITFLKQQTVAIRRSLEKEIPHSIAARDIFDVAPAEVLNGFLDRVETEIIPQRLFDQAEEFLIALLASSALKRHAEVASRAAVLLLATKAASQQSECELAELASHDLRFPNLESSQVEYAWSLKVAEAIQRRGCVFSPAF